MNDEERTSKNQMLDTMPNNVKEKGIKPPEGVLTRTDEGESEDEGRERESERTPKKLVAKSNLVKLEMRN